MNNIIIDTALLCLSLNIHFEAGIDPTVGKFAVGYSTMNRAQWKPERICAEVYRYKQFSWTISPPKEDPVLQARDMLVAERVAQRILKQRSKHDFTGGADHYHLCSMEKYPEWVKDMEFRGIWGSHCFYKRKRTNHVHS